MQKRMKKNNKKIKPDAVQRFKDACNDIAEAVNKQLFDGSRKWYWIGDDIGGACDFEEVDILNPDDMVRIIENRTTYDEYAEWREANLDHAQYINLKSWLMGLRHDMIKEENNKQ